MNILFIGDIFAKPGRDIAKRAIPALVAAHSIDLVVANVENSAAGFGVTGDIADTILEFGVDVMTSGNHVWDKKEVLEYIARQPRLLRPRLAKHRRVCGHAQRAYNRSPPSPACALDGRSRSHTAACAAGS